MLGVLILSSSDRKIYYFYRNFGTGMPAIPTFRIGKNGQDPRIWDPGIAITSVDDLDILFLLAM